VVLSQALARAQVPVSGTLRDVITSLDAGALGVALVMADASTLAGIFTDGDVRRSLLRGATLESPLQSHMKREFTSVSPAIGRAEVLDLMQARRFTVVPIVDQQGMFRGCHHLHDLLGVAPRANWAVIMAGGRGTRLGPLTEKLPKPMIRVAGRPILERMVLHLVGFGVRRIFLSVNYLAHIIEDHFGDGARFGCRIEYLREDRPLGTGGALSLLPEAPSAPVLLVNGDVVTQADLGAMLDAHVAGGPNVAVTVATRRYLHTVPFGCFELDGTRVVGMEEKPTLTRMINAGMYVVSPEVVAGLDRAAEFTMPTLLEQCMARGSEVHAFEVAEDWIDVGQKEQLREARGETP
jgi:dTDP-glucose pyrophosphorylase